MKMVLIILLALTATLYVSCPPAEAVDGAVISYQSLDRISDESFQRIMDEDSVRYICVQQILLKNWYPKSTKQRAEKLAKAGKRIVLQIWWGPSKDFPWSKYSYPNIALDKKLRADFFREVVDVCIAGYGAENLYGVHLMEETGMQFGTDVGPRDDPDDFWTFTEPANSYSTPWYSGYGDPKVGRTNIPNVRRHESDFTRMTGFKFANSDKWGELENHLFDRWVSTRLQSGAQVEFAKYIHRKYPKLKAFTWDLMNSLGENPRTDHQLEARYFDGVLIDPYNTITCNFNYQRAYRVIYPKAEIINFSMGGMKDVSEYPYGTLDQKRTLATGAYLSGVDVFGFFENPQDYNNPDSWKINTNILSDIKELPRFNKKSSVLLISDRIGDIFSARFTWTELKYFDFLPTWEAHNIDLSRYKFVILHSGQGAGDSLIYWNSNALKEKYGLPGYLDYREFDKFVANGGVLIISGETRIKQDCPLFIAREGYLHTADSGGIAQQPMVVSPIGWLKNKAGLKREYRCSVTSIPVTHDPKRVVKTHAGYFFRHGNGAVFFLPYQRLYNPSETLTSQEWQDCRQLHSDITRGVLEMMGMQEVAQEYFHGPEGGHDYMLTTSDDGHQTACTIAGNWPKSTPISNWNVKGKDVFSKTESPVLSNDNSAVIFNNKPAGNKSRY